jgi:DNA-binding Lrp family transcriptional regulator
MERTGFSEGVVAFPHWQLLGYQAAFAEVSVEGPPHRAQAVRDLSQLHGVLCVEENFGTELIVTVLAHSPAGFDRSAALMRRLRGIRTVKGPRPIWDPPVAAGLGPSDWALIQALQGAPVPTPAVLASRLRLTSRTVSRRLLQLVGSGVLQIRRPLNYARYPGQTFGDFEISLGTGASWDGVRRNLLRLFPDYIWLPPPAAEVPGGPSGAALVVGSVPFDSPAAAADAEHQLAELRGVDGAAVHLARRDVWSVEWLLEETHRQFSKDPQRVRPSGRPRDVRTP